MKSFRRFHEDAKRCDADDEIGEIISSRPVRDVQRMSERLNALRLGLRALLDEDDALDERLLRQLGITRWDTATEASDPAQTAATQDVANAKRQELVARRRVLQAKQSQLVAKQRKVQRDITKAGGAR